MCVAGGRRLQGVEDEASLGGGRESRGGSYKESQKTILKRVMWIGKIVMAGGKVTGSINETTASGTWWREREQW